MDMKPRKMCGKCTRYFYPEHLHREWRHDDWYMVCASCSYGDAENEEQGTNDP